MPSLSELLNSFFNAMKQTNGAVILFIIVGVAGFAYFVFKR